MANGNHTTCCAAAAIAQGHINRAARLLAAADEMSNLTGGVFRQALKMALQSLGEASAAIEIERAEAHHG